MNVISQYLTQYVLRSPNGQFVAKYVGCEYGMGSPTLGNFTLHSGSGEKLYSFPGFAQASFSDDSNYFIYKKPFGAGSSLTSQDTVIELKHGKEVWITEFRRGDFAEVVAPEVSLTVNHVPIKTLLNNDLAFDISLCALER